MTLSSLIGQPRAVEVLRAVLGSSAVHHAHLFTGPDGVGKERAAVGFVQALLCGEAPGSGCGACERCHRVEKGVHPDVLWLMPDEERIARGLAARSDFAGTPSRDIRVEQVRALQERLSLRGLESPRKVAVITPAHAMNVQAQNALLKTLEEPPPETLLVLVSAAPERLLPTLRSRCSTVQFAPLAAEQIAAHLQEVRELSPEKAALVAALSGGSLSRALALDAEALAGRREVIERFEALAPGDALPLLAFAEAFGGSRDVAEQLLALLASWTRDVLLTQVGAGRLAHQDLEPLAREVAARTPPWRLHRRYALLERTHEAIRGRNGAPRLQLEGMLVELLEAA